MKQETCSNSVQCCSRCTHLIENARLQQKVINKQKKYIILLEYRISEMEGRMEKTEKDEDINFDDAVSSGSFRTIK